jgi:hypothetical protein
MLLCHLEVDYTEKRYGQAEWFEETKPNSQLNFPNLPYWLDGDVETTESLCILH